MRQDKEKGKEQPDGLFFHRLRPPDELHGNQTITGAQIRSGETRQDLKIPTVSDGSLPRALSCSHPEVYPLQSAVPLLCGGVFSFLPVQLGSC